MHDSAVMPRQLVSIINVAILMHGLPIMHNITGANAFARIQ